ncbi:RHS repeat-associated core domain-containing protein [Streptomyces sp. NPDC047315]|uniref:RHS repeat-associated core domain-containing protein n=1 Tax=Streptomyces sp. NPDC047315 TaxID=3155142 RepID=UPI0033EB6151
MSARTTRNRRAYRRRWVAVVVLTLSTVLTASTVQAVPVLADATRTFEADKPTFDDPAKGTRMKAEPRPVDTTKKAAVTGLDRADWPVAGSATGTLTPGRVTTLRPGGLPLTLSAPTARKAAKAPVAAGPVRVEVVEPGRATELGAAALLKVTSGESATGSTRKEATNSTSKTPTAPGATSRLGVDYTSFAEGHGGGYGARLALYQLPACAVTAAPGSKACPQQPVLLQAVNDSEKKTLSADVPVGTGKGAPLLAVAATPNSSQGTYSATPLAPSASWSVAPSSGGFSWSYPLRAVPTPGGFQPPLGLSYNSQSTDGKTAITNNQGSWAGEGFTYEPGYIERQYKACADDGHKTSGELCWAHDNATIVLNGSSGQLIKDDATGEWRMTGDSNWKIEKLTGAVNGDDNGEHWKVVTEGTEYYFGLNRRLGWAAGKPETKSTWTVPVTGDDSGEPCYNPVFASASCQQGWRWNLDFVKDLNDNTISYFYEKEQNAYARGGKTDVDGTEYTRGGYLARVEYGQRHGALFTEAAAARVLFKTEERCEKTADFDCDAAKWTAANAARWPDTPQDRYCAVGTKCTFSQSTPSFFTRKKLTTVTTQVRTGAATYADVDAWHLKHIFTDNGDSSKTLWLNEIQHEGRGNGGSIKLPAVKLIGDVLDNRVDTIGNNLAPIKRFRLRTVLSESGAQLDVTYKPVECVAGSLPAPGASTKRCYPVVWAPPGNLEPITDWFHKHVVAEVEQFDRTGGSAQMVTRYDYLDEAGWRKAKPDGITDPKFLTWGVWQGYGKVRVTSGTGQNMTSRVDYTYLKGLHGDEKPGGGTRASSVTDSDGTIHSDLEEYTGFELEKAAYDGSKLVSKVINTPWHRTTGTQTRTWDGKQVITKASVVRTQTTLGLKALNDGTWRKSKSATTFDTTTGAVGRELVANDLGDLSTLSDDKCTRTSYADNPALNLYKLPSRVETVSVGCDADPNLNTQVVKDERTHYDGKPYGAAPTRGLATKTERLTGYNGIEPQYQTTGTTTYDVHGRPLSQTDSANATTTVTYAETNGLISKTTSKNHLNHLTTTEYEPAWGQAKAQTDPNNRRTDLVFDALGRLTSVWLPDRPKSTQTASIKYDYLIRQDDVSAVKTEKIGNGNAYNVPEYQLYDALLRPRQHQTEGPHGTRMVADTWYDGLGKVAKTNTTYNALGAPSDKLLNVPDGEVGKQTLNLYDGMARPTVEIFAIAGHEQWRTTTTYDATAEGDRIHADPPQGAVPTTTISNEAGQVTEVRHFDGAAPTVSGPLGEHTKTTYTYRPAGQLATVTDAQNNVWTYEYDQLGRKTKTVDPDAGPSTVRYDAADRPVTTTDARGKSIHTTYDVIGRPVATYEGTDTTGTKLTERKYDRSGALGYPYASYRYTDGTNAFASVITNFDTFYRPKNALYSVPATEGAFTGPLVYTTDYNRDGTVQRTSVPGVGGLPAETLVTGYDDLQRPVTLTGATDYVTNTAWTPTSQLSTLTLSAGAKQSQQHYFYERGTDRVTRQLVTMEGLPRAAKDVRTSYDQAGNVLSIADTADTTTSAATDVQCYAYDGQRRLTEVWTPGATAATADGSGTVGMKTPEYNGKTPTACTSAKPGATPLGGPSPYWTSYSFDKIGNRTKEVRHDIGGTTANDVVRTYSYADANQNGTPKEAGDGGPHAVTKVSEKTATGVQESMYGYDPAGNTTKRTLSGDKQTLTWNAEGKVESITEPDDPTTPDKNEASTTTFLYDGDGNRIKRTDPSGSTFYLPDGTEVHLPTGPDAKLQGTRYYSHAGQPVAVRTHDGKFSLIASDHHGTGDVAIDTATGAVTQRRVDPYGNPRTGNTGTWPGQKGFVGGTIDASTGLTNIGARQYDASLGKFISVDPIIDVTDPQQMNAYAYSNNNPTTFTDPTGLRVACGGSTGLGCPTPPKPNVKKDASNSVSRAEVEVRGAQASQESAKQRIVSATKELVKILMDELGVTAGLDCISSGDVAACGETVLNIAGSFLGGLAGKAVAKYGLPWKWDDGAKLAKRIGGLASDLISGVKEYRDASKKLDKARDRLAAAESKFKEIVTKCRTHSFLPGTQVLLADGSTKQIEDVSPGNEILTTDPKTGEEVVRKVVGTIVTEDDKDFVDLSITADGVTSSLISTTTHPFWVESESDWIEAGDLKPGMRLTTPEGATAVLDDTRYFEKRQRTHDLTIESLHAYYVLAEETPLLVHNCNFDRDAEVGKLPAYKAGGPTSGRAVSADGTAYDLVSGNTKEDAALVDWVNGTLRERGVLPGASKSWRASDVEQKFAAIMARDGIADADLVINFPTGPCTVRLGCDQVMDTLLGGERSLTVHWQGTDGAWQSRRYGRR